MARIRVEVTSSAMGQRDDGSYVHFIGPEPLMPTFHAAAILEGESSDLDLDDVAFSWQLEVSFLEDGRNDTLLLPSDSWAIVNGGNWTVDAPQDVYRGGDLVVRVGVDLPDGQSMQGDSTLDRHAILGLNPQKGDVRAVIAEGTVYQAVFWQETRFTQFRDGLGVANAFVDGPHGPIRGRDPGGSVGWGVGQLTDPAPTAEQLWNWHANIDASLDRLRAFREAATTYVRQVQSGDGWTDDTGGTPPNEGTGYPNAPDMTDDQLDLEMLARWNGHYRYHNYDPATENWLRRLPLGRDGGTSLPYADRVKEIATQVDAGQEPNGW